MMKINLTALNSVTWPYNKNYKSRDKQIYEWCVKTFGPYGYKQKWNYHHQPSQGRYGKYWIEIYDDSFKTLFKLRWQ